MDLVRHHTSSMTSNGDYLLFSIILSSICEAHIRIGAIGKSSAGRPVISSSSVDCKGSISQARARLFQWPFISTRFLEHRGFGLKLIFGIE